MLITILFKSLGWACFLLFQQLKLRIFFRVINLAMQTIENNYEAITVQMCSGWSIIQDSYRLLSIVD